MNDKDNKPNIKPEATTQDVGLPSTALFSPTDFKTWWKSEAHRYNLMMGETVFQFAERMAKMAYGQGVIEGMNQQRMGIYPENAQDDSRDLSR